MGVLVDCKNEEDPIKNEGARVVTTLFIDFSHAQGQLNTKSVMESCPNSNPSKLLWLTLLPARIKKIHWKMKALEWSQRFSHYKSNAQGQLTHKSFVRYCPISNPSDILWLSLLPARIKKNQSKMKELEWSQGFPHYNITLWELSDAMETRVLIRSGPKPNGVNPPPQWCFWWNLITNSRLISEISMFESVDRRTDGRPLNSHPISSPWAFGSSELKCH